eukprot:COSAG04_NODE_13460_length_605_cov_1.227273_1_plen_54_part_10
MLGVGAVGFYVAYIAADMTRRQRYADVHMFLESAVGFGLASVLMVSSAVLTAAK